MEQKGEKRIFSEQEIENLIRNIHTKGMLRIAAGADHDVVYTAMAYEVMNTVHAGTFTKIGEPYLDHTIWVGNRQMPDLINTQIGYLHDVREHSNITAAHLKRMGFKDEVVTGVDLMTKPDGEKFYLDYGTRVGHNPRTRSVKKADMCHNNRDDRQPDEPLHEARVIRRECYRLLGYYYDYLDELEATGMAERVEKGEVSLGVFLYETDFLMHQTPAERELIRTALLTKSEDPYRMDWFKKATDKINNPDPRHPDFPISELTPCPDGVH